jgi:hypothetical protein
MDGARCRLSDSREMVVIIAHVRRSYGSLLQQRGWLGHRTGMKKLGLSFLLLLFLAPLAAPVSAQVVIAVGHHHRHHHYRHHRLYNR